jgi:hypothetical protein
MTKLVKLTSSPFTPDMEVVGDMLMRLGVHRAADSVAITLGDNIQDYKEQADQPGALVRQVTESIPTDQYRALLFDLQTNQTQGVAWKGRQVEIKLMQITRDKMEGHEFLSYEFQVSDAELAQLQRTGTVAFRISHPNQGWQTDPHSYDFGTVAKHGLLVSMRKNQDGNFAVSLSGPAGKAVSFVTRIPPCKNNSLFVSITWGDSSVKLSLNAELMDTKEI